eukprot:Skav227957  [mRNA]  locus=scaffold146:700657:701236:- [translate_table: standard]
MATRSTCLAVSGFTDLAQLLLSRGAHLNSADRDGWTPLICAARGGHQQVVECLGAGWEGGQETLLLLSKASPHARDSLGRTALRHAKMAGYQLKSLEECEEPWSKAVLSINGYPWNPVKMVDVL